jgi:hypothetical protein
MGVHQQNQADRDVYAAGRDQTVINDNRRVELAAGAVPHPAAVDLAGPVAPRVAAAPGAGVRVPRYGAGRAGAGAGGAGRGGGDAGGVPAWRGRQVRAGPAVRHRADYGLVWWITAADAVKAGLAGLAGRLCLLGGGGGHDRGRGGVGDRVAGGP